jgi:hypothetical protein
VSCVVVPTRISSFFCTGTSATVRGRFLQGLGFGSEFLCRLVEPRQLFKNEASSFQLHPVEPVRNKKQANGTRRHRNSEPNPNAWRKRPRTVADVPVQKKEEILVGTTTQDTAHSTKTVVGQESQTSGGPRQRNQSIGFEPRWTPTEQAKVKQFKQSHATQPKKCSACKGEHNDDFPCLQCGGRGTMRRLMEEINAAA